MSIGVSEYVAGVRAEADEQIEWYQDEWNMMSDDLERVRDERTDAEERVTFLSKQLSDLHVKYQSLQTDFHDSIAEKNHTISNKLVALSNLVDEYDRIFARYVHLTGTKLITDKIKQYRKQGGYGPL